VVCAHFDPLLLSHSRLFYAITVTLDSLIQVTRGEDSRLQKFELVCSIGREREKKSRIMMVVSHAMDTITRVERSVAGKKQTSGSISSRTWLVHALDPPRSLSKMSRKPFTVQRFHGSLIRVRDVQISTGRRNLRAKFLYRPSVLRVSCISISFSSLSLSLISITMSQFDIQSISSRSTSSAIPSSTTSFGQISNRKNGEGFVAPNSRRGGRNFKVVEIQKSNASLSVDKKGKGGKGFRKALGELIAGRSNLRNVAAERRDNDDSSQLSSNGATFKNCGTTSNWVHEEARRSQLREDELRRHEAVSRRGESMVESLDDQSFYAFVSSS